jgi:protein TonB
MAVTGTNKGSGDGAGAIPSEAPIGQGAFRSVVAVALGVLTAFGLFWIMQALISVPFELADAGKKLSIDFVRLRKDTTPDEKEREKPQKQKPEQQPPPPEMNVAKNMNPSDAVGEIIPMIDTSAQLAEATSLTGGGSDRAEVPLVTVDPDYPERARQQGVTGWVDVEFTITPVGTVTDARVINSKPPSIFDRAALQAVQRWKYNPMIRDGVAVSRKGVRFRFNFENPGKTR